MNDITITSAQYINDFDGNQAGVKATIDGTEMFVPLDTSNRHYTAIKAKHDDADDSFTIQEAD